MTKGLPLKRTAQFNDFREASAVKKTSEDKFLDLVKLAKKEHLAPNRRKPVERRIIGRRTERNEFLLPINKIFNEDSLEIIEKKLKSKRLSDLGNWIATVSLSDVSQKDPGGYKTIIMKGYEDVGFANQNILTSGRYPTKKEAISALAAKTGKYFDSVINSFAHEVSLISYRFTSGERLSRATDKSSKKKGVSRSRHRIKKRT